MAATFFILQISPVRGGQASSSLPLWRVGFLVAPTDRRVSTLGVPSPGGGQVPYSEGKKAMSSAAPRGGSGGPGREATQGWVETVLITPSSDGAEENPARVIPTGRRCSSRRGRLEKERNRELSKSLVTRYRKEGFAFLMPRNCIWKILICLFRFIYGHTGNSGPLVKCF